MKYVSRSTFKKHGYSLKDWASSHHSNYHGILFEEKFVGTCSFKQLDLNPLTMEIVLNLS
jgi:hypothetical protein